MLFARAASAINIQTNIHVISSALCHLHSPPECSASRVQRIIFPKVTRKVHVSLRGVHFITRNIEALILIIEENKQLLLNFKVLHLYKIKDNTLN